jgi:hypothetical protein
MLDSILDSLYKLCLILLTFNAVLFIQYLVHSLSMRRAFRNIPGPPASSFIWGEEWELYHGPPGKPYVDWHKRFGKILKFTGAFGVGTPICFTAPMSDMFLIVTSTRLSQSPILVQ